jgi:hypothetical protein
VVTGKNNKVWIFLSRLDNFVGEYASHLDNS